MVPISVCWVFPRPNPRRLTESGVSPREGPTALEETPTPPAFPFPCRGKEARSGSLAGPAKLEREGNLCNQGHPLLLGFSGADRAHWGVRKPRQRAWAIAPTEPKKVLATEQGTLPGLKLAAKQSGLAKKHRVHPFLLLPVIGFLLLGFWLVPSDLGISPRLLSV